MSCSTAIAPLPCPPRVLAQANIAISRRKIAARTWKSTRHLRPRPYPLPPSTYQLFRHLSTSQAAPSPQPSRIMKTRPFSTNMTARPASPSRKALPSDCRMAKRPIRKIRLPSRTPTNTPKHRLPLPSPHRPLFVHPARSPILLPSLLPSPLPALEASRETPLDARQGHRHRK